MRKFEYKVTRFTRFGYLDRREGLRVVFVGFIAMLECIGSNVGCRRVCQLPKEMSSMPRERREFGRRDSLPLLEWGERGIQPLVRFGNHWLRGLVAS